MSEIKTRFAPSPTGFMHIGNLRTALYSYLVSKSQGGKFVLRIEDTDQVRHVDGAEEVILKTLEMTGIDYDEGPYVQSERLDIYKEYADKLIKSGHAYYCFCTPERLESLKDEKGIGGYDGHCRISRKKKSGKISLTVSPMLSARKCPIQVLLHILTKFTGKFQ